MNPEEELIQSTLKTLDKLDDLQKDLERDQEPKTSGNELEDILADLPDPSKYVSPGHELKISNVDKEFADLDKIVTSLPKTKTPIQTNNKKPADDDLDLDALQASLSNMTKEDDVDALFAPLQQQINHYSGGKKK